MSTITHKSLTETATASASSLRLNPRRVVSALWLFAILNYLYCDVLASVDPEAVRALISESGPEGVELTPGFLLAAAVLMTIPMGSVLASRIAPYRFARWSSVVAGIIMTIVQVGTLFVGTTTMYYAYFSAIEIATTATIVLIAWRWRAEA
jgi:hypothetical protein